ncbi:nucleotide-binding alpha-beta plait domain-containing protein [Tanacetum coccineum]
MGDRRPKEDGVYNIFTSIFVTNFPDQTNAKELWRLCNQYGNVIDSFIPNRRSKVGKRFGFVRFIKIYDVERLVNNLCTIWIGNFELHANIAKFNRTPLHKGNHLPNIHANVRPAPVVSSKTHGDSSSYIQAVKAASKENFMSHVGVNSWFIKILQDSSSFVVDERVTWIDIEEDASDSDDESVDSKLVDNHKESPLENDSESEVIPETVFEEQANVESKSTASKDVTNERSQRSL